MQLRRLDSTFVSLPLATDHPSADRNRRTITAVAVAALGFIAVSAVLILLGRLAIEHQVAIGRQEFEPGVGWFGQWVRWDGNWYYRIAHDGYSFTAGQQRAVAFWPSYPMSIRGLALLTNDEYDAGLIITWLSGFATITLLARWCQDRMTRMASIAAVITLLLFPYAWYMHFSVYGDALFAACAIGAFLLLERDKTVLAGLLGAFAAAGRPMGLAVAAGLLVLAMERRGALPPMLAKADVPGSSAPVEPEPRWRRMLLWVHFPRSLRLRELKVKDAGVLLSLLGPLAYMGFLWQTEGTPFAFADAESAPGWEHKPGPATWLKLNVIGGLRNAGLTQETAGMLLHGFLAVGAVLLIPKVIRRFGWGYGAFCIVLIGIPVISSKDFYGLGRYMIPAFPVVAVAGEWLSGRPVWLRVSIWTLSGTMLAFLGYSYARGLYLA